MNQDLLITSNVLWFLKNSDDVIRNIPRATFGNDPGMEPPPVVQDAETRRGVAVAHEPPPCWSYVTEPGGDIEHPNVFHFIPRSRLAQRQYPTAKFNLAQYVVYMLNPFSLALLVSLAMYKAA